MNKELVAFLLEKAQDPLTYAGLVMLAGLISHTTLTADQAKELDFVWGTLMSGLLIWARGNNNANPKNAPLISSENKDEKSSGS